MKLTRTHHLSSLRSGGFTLLELLLSLALTTLLMGVVFTALDMHWRFSLTGQEDAERAQIARAVFQRMTADIRSVVYRPDKPAGTASDSSSSSSTDSSSGTSDSSSQSTSQTGNQTGNQTSGTGTNSSSPQGSQSQTGSSQSGSQTPPTEPLAPTDAFSGVSLGVFGDSQTLVMHVSRPARSVGAPVNDALFGSGDLKSVSYYLGSTDGSMPAAFGAALPTSPEGSQGLMRRSADQLSLSVATPASDGSTEGTSELLAPEIVSLSFRYHDGVSWVDSWDSSVDGGLPTAIGITIGFRDPPATASNAIRREASNSTSEFRIVVTIPQANPFEGLSF